MRQLVNYQSEQTPDLPPLQDLTLDYISDSARDVPLPEMLRRMYNDSFYKRICGYLETLGLTIDELESVRQLNKVYRQQSLSYHPDKNVNGSDEEKATATVKFKKIQEATEQMKKHIEYVKAMQLLAKRVGNDAILFHNHHHYYFMMQHANLALVQESSDNGTLRLLMYLVTTREQAKTTKALEKFLSYQQPATQLLGVLNKYLSKEKIREYLGKDDLYGLLRVPEINRLLEVQDQGKLVFMLQLIQDKVIDFDLIWVVNVNLNVIKFIELLQEDPKLVDILYSANAPLETFCNSLNKAAPFSSSASLDSS